MKSVKETNNFLKSKTGRGPKKSVSKEYSKKEEERILKYALQLSQEEALKPKDKFTSIADIPFCTTHQATELDFSDIITYFDGLWSKNGQSTGIIKIKAPDSWKNYNKVLFDQTFFPKFLDCEKKLDSRKMVLGELHTAKKFDYSKKYNFKEYFEAALQKEKELFSKEPFDHLKKEELYWKLCLDHGNLKTETDYAADIPLNKYFSIKEITHLHHISKSQSLSSLYLKNNSLFKFIDKQQHISGVTFPWFYFGMAFSTFCWHTEDLYMYSVNYMHYGEAKIWYSVPHNQKEKMDEFIKKKYFATMLKHPDLVHKLTVFIDPLELINNGIEVYKAYQEPGDIIITLPEGYHCGFNSGFNIAEAVNFASVKWLDYGFKAALDYLSKKKKTPVFSLEWLVIESYAKSQDTKQKEKLKEYMNQIIKEEKEKRAAIEAFLVGYDIKFDIRDTYSSDYDDCECNSCGYFAFLSYLYCNNCKLKSCTNHFSICKCLPQSFSLIYNSAINLK